MSEHETLTGKGYLALLRTNKLYRRLWLAQVVSLLGDWFDLVAAVAIISRFSDSALAVSAFLIVRLVPPVIIGPFAGVVADRFNRRNLMLVADLCRALIVLSFLLVRSPDLLWIVYIAAFLQFSLSALFDPSRSAIIPTITSPEERVAANALSSLTWSLLLAIGAALGGFVTGIFGTDLSFVIDALSFVGSAVFVAGIPKSYGVVREDPQTQASFTKDFVSGLTYVKARPLIGAYIWIKPLAAVTGGMYVTLLAVQAHTVYPIGQDAAVSFGLLYLAIGLGTGTGPLVGSKLLVRMGENRTNLHRLIGVGFMLFGAGYAVFGSMSILPLAMLFIILGEIGGGAQWVFSTTLLQLSVAHEYRGRVAAVELALLGLVNSLSLLVGGLLLDQLHLPVAAITLGGFGLQTLIGLLWLVIIPRISRRAQPATSEVERALL